MSIQPTSPGIPKGAGTVDVLTQLQEAALRPKTAPQGGIGIGPLQGKNAPQTPAAVLKATGAIDNAAKHLRPGNFANAIRSVLGPVRRALGSKEYQGAMRLWLSRFQGTLIEQGLVENEPKLHQALKELNWVTEQLRVGTLELVPAASDDLEVLGYRFKDHVPDGMVGCLSRAPKPGENFGALEASSKEQLAKVQQGAERGSATRPMPGFDPALVARFREHMAPVHDENRRRMANLLEGLMEQVQHLPPEEQPKKILEHIEHYELMTTSEIVDTSAYTVDNEKFYTAPLYTHHGDPPESSFHVRIFAWGTGQMTLPHGHRSHGAVFASKGDVWQIMYTGQKDWVDGESKRVRPTDVFLQRRGAVAKVSGELEDESHIHAMGQSLAGDGVNVTVHFYYGAPHDAEDDLPDVETSKHRDLHRQNYRLPES